MPHASSGTPTTLLVILKVGVCNSTVKWGNQGPKRWQTNGARSQTQIYLGLKSVLFLQPGILSFTYKYTCISLAFSIKTPWRSLKVNMPPWSPNLPLCSLLSHSWGHYCWPRRLSQVLSGTPFLIICPQVLSILFAKSCYSSSATTIAPKPRPPNFPLGLLFSLNYILPASSLTHSNHYQQNCNNCAKWNNFGFY